MTQTPRSPFNGYINIPEDEKFNPNRPTLDAICSGNRTMGNILNYFSHRAGLEAERQKLGKDCKVVTISIDREKVLQDLDISEKTYIMYMKRFRALKYILSKRYSRHYEVNFEAINEAIAQPPAPTRLGRPPKTESCTNSSQESTSTSKERGSTYVQELERKVEVLSCELKVLDEKVKSLELSGKVLDENRKVLAFPESRLAALEQAFSAVFGDPKNYKNLVDAKEESSDAVTSPVFASSDHSQHSSYSLDGYTQTDSIGNNSIQDGYSPNEPDTLSEDVTQAADGNTRVHGYRKSVEELGGTHDSHTSRSVHPDRVFDRDALEDTGHTERDTAGATGNPSPAGVPLAQQTPLTQTMASALSGDARERTIVPPSAALLPSHTYDTLDVFAEDTWRVVPGQATGATSGEETLPLSTEHAADNGTSDGVQGSTTQPASPSKTGQTDKNKKVGSPIMPEDTALWNAETLVQVCEAYKGRRYPNGAKKKSDRIRDTELVAAESLLTEASDIWTEDTAENRENLLKIIKHVQNRDNKWWLKNVEGGHVHPHHLVAKDRIHTMWDELHPRPSGGNRIISLSGRTLPIPTDVPVADELWYERLRTQNMQGAAYR